MEEGNLLYYFFLLVSLFAAELFYFRLAVKFQIIDKPNDRSSHLKPVIRGGGVIFILALIFWFAAEQGLWPWFMLGLLAVSVISFMDDLYPQKAGVRFMMHLTAMMLLFYETGLFSWPLWLALLALVVCIGTINAFNFMDGINGITGVYSLITVLSFLYVQQSMVSFTAVTFLVTLVISILVFLFFNFRKHAKCFAGDVGSVTLAFSLIFILLQLLVSTHNFVWVLFLLVYGTDSVITIIYRLTRGENIFRPHRTHLYQYLSNELKYPHLGISVLYGALQLLINGVVILFLKEFNVAAAIFVVSFMAGYIVVRECILRKIGLRGLFIRPLAS